MKSATRRRKKIGSPPGTVFYSGEERFEEVTISLIEYNETDFFEKDFSDFDSCTASFHPNTVKWINVNGIHKEEVLEKVGKAFNIHPLTLEDIANTSQRPKFEDYDNYVVAIMKMLYYESAVRSEQLSILLFDNMVISFQEVFGGDAFDLIRNRLRQGKGRIRKYAADYLAYALIDATVDCYFSILEKVGDKIELLEEELANHPNKSTLSKIYQTKREMIFLRKVVWPLRELISSIERSETSLIKQSTEIYLRDVQDHLMRVIDTVETYRDLLASMMDIYLSSMSNKMNEVMKVLTIISTVFIPVTFIAGVYGMNFKYMPELESPYAYWITWSVMLAIMLSLLYYFKRKKWL